MAQPIFLRNFTLNGVDIGELFTVGTVTIPFMNVERGYYQVGNTDGQHLLHTRIGNTTLTFDGHVITEHSGLSVSDTKDLLVSQMMSREPMQLVFDALPDRYFNVVYEGATEYDATNLEYTPLTLTFSCPEGVSHSIADDVFRNTQSTSTNFLADSEFLTSTFWNDDAYVLPTKINNSNVMVLDYSDEQIEDMDESVNDFVSDDVFYPMDDLTQGAMITHSVRYAVTQPSEIDDDGASTFEIVIDELDKENGTVLYTHQFPMANTGQIYRRYAFNSTGTDRMTDTLPNRNLIQNNVSSTLKDVTVSKWSGSVMSQVTLETLGVSVDDTIVFKLKIQNPSTGLAEVSARINFYQDDGTYTNISGNTIPAGQTGYSSVSGTVPDGCTGIALRIHRKGGTDGLDSFTIQVAEEKLEIDNTATVFTLPNSGTVDNTTPPYVGYSTKNTNVPTDYTWLPNGTGIPNSMIALTPKANTLTIQSAETKVLRLSMNVYGNSKVIINQPLLARGNTGTYVKSNKTYLTTMPMSNNGTWKSYPIFEITNNKPNGMIGIVNDDGAVLQFGNEENVDETEPTKNETGFYHNYTASSQPSGTTVNAGHVSQYPYTGGDTAKPNLYLGSWDWSSKDVAKPKWASSFATGAWSGMSLTSSISAPSTGLRTGAFEYVERIDFGTDAEKRGRFEIVVLTDANDILMSTTIRDSNQSANEVIIEYWYGNKRLKSITTNIKKYKNTWFRVTMSRDKTGKIFNWNFENIQTKNNKIVGVTKNAYKYKSPEVNKASVLKTSRWVLKWDNGTATRSVVDKTTYTMKSKQNVNIRSGSKTSSKVLGVLPKNVTFDTVKKRTGQKVVNNTSWYYVTKNTSKKIPASGWVTGYWLTQTKKVETKKNIQVSAISKMHLTDSRFTWMGASKPKETKDPFKAGDKIVIDTADKSIFVNGVEREDLATIGNQWERFATEVGNHYFRFVNSSWQTNTMEVTLRNKRVYL